MDKSIYTPEHQTLIELLRELRANASLTQEDVAARIGRHQPFVSGYESGQRRLDVVELATIAQALNTDIAIVVAEWLRRLDQAT